MIRSKLEKSKPVRVRAGPLAAKRTAQRVYSTKDKGERNRYANQYKVAPDSTYASVGAWEGSKVGEWESLSASPPRQEPGVSLGEHISNKDQRYSARKVVNNIGSGWGLGGGFGHHSNSFRRRPSSILPISPHSSVSLHQLEAYRWYRSLQAEQYTGSGKYQHVQRPPPDGSPTDEHPRAYGIPPSTQ